MDCLVNEKLNILKKPFGIPIHLKDDPFAKKLWKYANNFFNGKIKTTILEIHEMVNKQIKEDQIHRGKSYIDRSLITIPIHQRTVLILVHFTK